MTGTRFDNPARPVDIQIRRYHGVTECEVVIAANGRELIVACPNYDGALRWALMECRAYRVTPNFADAPSGLHAA